MLDGFARAGLFTDHGPIVGVNANASNPHYEPTEGRTQPIRARRFRAARHVGEAGPAGRGLLRHHLDGRSAASRRAEMRKVFGIVRDARDAAIERVQKAVTRGEADSRIRSGRRGARRHRARPDSASSSSTARATPSARRCTATARTWTIWRRTTSAA